MLSVCSGTSATDAAEMMVRTRTPFVLMSIFLLSMLRGPVQHALVPPPMSTSKLRFYQRLPSQLQPVPPLWCGVVFFCSCVRFSFDCTVHMARRSSCIWGQCESYIPYGNLENKRYTVSHVGGYGRVKSDCHRSFRLKSMYCDIAPHFAEVEIHVMVHLLSQPILHTECKIYHTTRSEYVIVAKYI